MKTFKIIAAPLALAAAALGVTASAQAQPMYGHGPNRHGAVQGGWMLTPARSAAIRQDIAQLRNQIDRAAARRAISPREATGLRRQANEVQRLYARYQRGGLTRDEVRALQDRVNQVRVALRMERLDWDNRRG
jgi:hypothetical protein